MPLPLTILLCLLCVLFARPILRVLKIAIILCALAALLRGLWLLLPELAAVDWSGAVLSGGVVAVVLIFGYRTIHNWLVDADLARTIERDKAQAKARRI